MNWTDYTKSTFVFFLTFIANSAIAQLNPTLISALDSSLQESSGIEYASPQTYWTHNDSGDGPYIYEVNNSGNKIRTIYITNSIAEDVEDIAQDSNGNLYVADVGNNNHDRTNLRIYKISNAQLMAGDTVTAEIIHYVYPDQLSFPPSNSNRNFDCEAVFHHAGMLHLFSKNWGTSNYSKYYTLPEDSGTYAATFVDSLFTQNWITAADINPNGNVMALLSLGKLILFTDFSGTIYFTGTIQDLFMPASQKEGLLFLNNDSLVMTDELFFGTGGNIYAFSVANYSGIDQLFEIKKPFAVYPNPAKEFLKIVSLNLKKENHTLKIADTNSKVWHSETLQFDNVREIQIDISLVPNGMYILSIMNRDQQYNYLLVIIK